ncbi:MAG: hypothetical protein HY698_09760 [Deltaproteobacteria bacterium]|nr:hypothetical protein [Deltaproteobacteria bacterium]
MSATLRFLLPVLLVTALVACGGGGSKVTDAGLAADARPTDAATAPDAASTPDAAQALDSAPADSGTSDALVADALPPDALPMDSGPSTDAGLPRTAYPGAPPVMKHSPYSCVNDCASCHSISGMPAPLTPHPERTMCRQCHLPQQDVPPFRGVKNSSSP